MSNWERHVAGGLALLRAAGSPATTRSTSSASTPTSTEHAILPALRPLYERWFRVEVNGIDNIPAEGGALLVANHAGGLWALDAAMTALAVHVEHPARPVPAHARRRPGVPHAGARQRWPARPAARWPASEDAERLLARRRTGRRLAGGVQGHRQAVPRALQAAAVRPRRVRARGDQDRRADHPGVDRRLRGDPPGAGQRQDARPRARPALLPAHPDVSRGSARSGSSRCRASGTSSSARRSTPTPRLGRRRRRRRMSSSSSPTGCARRSRARSTGCSSSAARSGAEHGAPRERPNDGYWPCLLIIGSVVLGWREVVVDCPGADPVYPLRCRSRPACGCGCRPRCGADGFCVELPRQFVVSGRVRDRR